MYLQLAENNLSAIEGQCGPKPLKPNLGIGDEAKARLRNPDKWDRYDRMLRAWNECRENKDKSTAGTGAVVLLAPGRALFNILAKHNVDGIATKLATEPWNDVKMWWNKVGGQSSKLAKFINEGKGKKPKKIGLLKKFRAGGALAEMENPFLSYSGCAPGQCQNYFGQCVKCSTGSMREYSPSYYLSAGEVQIPESVKNAIRAAGTAAGTTVGTIIEPGAGTAVGAPAGLSLGEVIIAILPLIKKIANKNEGEADVIPPQTPNLPTGTDQDTTTTTDAKKWILPAVVVGGLGLVWYLTKGKK